jgi:hypothetical protein
MNAGAAAAAVESTGGRTVPACGGTTHPSVKVIVGAIRRAEGPA